MLLIVRRQRSIQKEHRIVANVQKTMVALLKTKIPTEATEARIELEEIVREIPKHLNALADLETSTQTYQRILIKNCWFY
jgi:hypothetical protein